jgi:hypothetical protein
VDLRCGYADRLEHTKPLATADATHYDNRLGSWQLPKSIGTRAVFLDVKKQLEDYEYFDFIFGDSRTRLKTQTFNELPV